MSEKERLRKGVFEVVRAGAWSLVEAAEHLNMSYRQCKRSYKRYLAEGDAGLVHRSRGRPSNRRKDDALREAVLQRYEERYEGFGPTLAAEKLAEDGYEVDHETLRRWLMAEGKWRRQRKRYPFRQRRERRLHFGELVQMDGSIHHWFGQELPLSCLVKLIDDATGIRQGYMAEGETTEACMRALWQWIDRYGIPKALYTDKKNVFVTDREPTLEEQLAGEEPMTAFGKACAKLGIEIITANSPQAKGRVERAHGVDQDRLVKELALRGVVSVEGANELLAEGFMDKLNDKFAVPAGSEVDYHRSVPPDINLAQVFCFEESRVVAKDWVVRYQNRLFQIEKNNVSLPPSGRKVVVQRLLDGRIRLLYKGEALRYREIEPDQRQTSGHRECLASPLTIPKRGHKPAPDHPWRWSGRYRGGGSAAQAQG
ncbi:MAG: ISNCY family transposase [Candidatus Oleimicrobiaceae bacterium]